MLSRALRYYERARAPEAVTTSLLRAGNSQILVQLNEIPRDRGIYLCGSAILRSPSCDIARLQVVPGGASVFAV